MNQILKITELDYAPNSILDSFGRIFYYGKDVYRLIDDNATSSCLELLNSDFFINLMNKGMFPKTVVVTNLPIEGNHLILKHELCKISKPHEWSFEMYKAAAAFLLELHKECRKNGYDIKDAHPFNMTFSNGHPIFLDMGSFFKCNSGEWVAKEEFLRTMYIPLVLWRESDFLLLRTVLENPDMFIHRTNYCQNIYDSPTFSTKILNLKKYTFRKKSMCFSSGSHFLYKIVNLYNKTTGSLPLLGKRLSINVSFNYSLPKKNDILNIKNESYKTEWQNYQNFYPEVSFIEAKYPRFNRIIDLISLYTKNAHSLLDLAGNMGAFSYLVENKTDIESINTIDYDCNAVDKSFLIFTGSGSKINTLWANAILPCDYESTANRLKSDIVCALALTHHLLLKQQLPVDLIFQRISGYSNRYVVIEFMPLGLWDGVYAPPTPEWYDVEWFKGRFSKFFNILHEEKLEPNRILFIGEKLSI